jgi:CMP-N-acetylneuraminic acid synthetase
MTDRTRAGGADRIVALLPLKAHSERLAGKNFRDFLGKPLFRWMLDTLLAVPAIDRVVINTDARAAVELSGLGDRARLTVRDRAPDLCGDFVSMNRILDDDLRAVPADVYVMTHATNPLLSRDTIERALLAFQAAREREEADSLFAVNRYQSRFYSADGRALNHDPARLLRTQDLEPLFEENSNLYVFTSASFAATSARIGRRPLMFETPRLESIDIDDLAGWRLAEAIARQNAAVEPDLLPLSRTPDTQ